MILGATKVFVEHRCLVCDKRTYTEYNDCERCWRCKITYKPQVIIDGDDITNFTLDRFETVYDKDGVGYLLYELTKKAHERSLQNIRKE